MTTSVMSDAWCAGVAIGADTELSSLVGRGVAVACVASGGRASEASKGWTVPAEVWAEMGERHNVVVATAKRIVQARMARSAMRRGLAMEKIFMARAGLGGGGGVRKTYKHKKTGIRRSPMPVFC